MNMFTEFVLKKMKAARYELLDDGTYFGTIPGFRGVWGNAKNLEDCRKELQDAFEDWLMLKIHEHKKVPGLVLRFGKSVPVGK